MFDWNDEELRSIIWGEAVDGNNRADLYPEKYDVKSEFSPGDLLKNGTSEQSSFIGTFEQNKSMVISENGIDLAREYALELSTDSWLSPADPFSSNVAIEEQVSLCTDASNNSKKEGRSEEDGEESDYVFYGLANIGSFDDLDRIFSNNDSIFGDLTVIDAEEPYFSAENITGVLEFPPFSSETSDVTNRSSINQASSFGYEKMDELNHKASLALQPLVMKDMIQGSHKKLNDRSAANLKHNSHKGPRCLSGSLVNPSGYEEPLTNANVKNSESASKPPTMTPKEKIEKLRKRQQMRTILAIQKQKQQFNQKAESNISVVTGHCSVEESVLYQLQDAINKLDIGVRLSIRDSLFRLAKSATQRQNPNDTRSSFTSTKNEDIIMNQRFTRVPEAKTETETNPKDRIVAHLLFHKQIELPEKETESSSLKSIGNLYFQSTSSSSHSNKSRRKNKG